MQKRDVITVSRRWHEPQIRTTIDFDGISIQMPLEDFVEALKQEVGSVTWTFKKDSFNRQLDAAVERVVKGMKEETAKVV